MPETQTKFFLADRTVPGRLVRHLLLSSSFGVNALLYAVWLGYSLGVYSLIIQITWSLGFLLLNPFLKVHESSQGSSLPSVLGSKFGRPIEFYAAGVTALGLVMLLGWELAICSRTVIVHASAAMSSSALQSTWYSHLFLILAIVSAIYYTSTSGMSGNAKAAQVLNLIKIALLSIVTTLAVISLVQKPADALTSALFPSFSQIASSFGIVAVFTNLVFNLVWQIVDASVWQSVLAADPTARRAQFRVLSISALHIFVWVNLFGSIIGMSLAGVDGIDPDNILLKAVTRYSELSFVLLIGLFVTFACCLITFADGILLAITQVVTEDLLPALSRFAKSRVLRAIVMSVTALTAWLVVKLVEHSPFGLFNFVYILIIPQLSIVGGVVALLYARRETAQPSLTVVCGIALVIGVSLVFLGFLKDVKWAMEIGGSVTVIASLFSVLFCCSKSSHDAQKA